MPKQRDSSAALRSRTKSLTDEIKNRLLRQTGRRSDLGMPGITTGEKEVRNPPHEDRPRNSRGYAAGALEQSRWRNNSGPGPEAEDPCSLLLLRVKVQPPSQRHPGILNGGKPSHRVDIADTWREQLRVTFTCRNQRLKSEQLQTQKEHILKMLSLSLI